MSERGLGKIKKMITAILALDLGRQASQVYVRVWTWQGSDMLSLPSNDR